MNAPTPRVAHACFWSGGEGALDGDGANLDDDSASLDGDGASLDGASLDGGGALGDDNASPPRCARVFLVWRRRRQRPGRRRR